MKHALRKYPTFERALKEGVSGFNLAPMRDWNVSDLKKVIKEADAYHDSLAKELKETYEKCVFKPKIFLSKERSVSLDESYKDMQIEILRPCVEICAVAMYWLGKRKGKNARKQPIGI